ncbi:DUF4232 domain-containing protein [Streptomyces sp. NPDC048845]|uniref:DUF4232 domain-containing protein n=1 Tax=Streptomyces sp. NPDC048845 TaxID=3155390 RepID=UPI00341712B5
MTVIRTGPVLVLAVAAVLSSGCSSLARELERESDPARTATPSLPHPVPTAPAPELSPPPAGPDVTRRPGGAADCSAASGVRIAIGPVNGAMGLRALTVTLTNCDSEPYELNGYPSVRVLDENREPYDIEVLRGTGGIPMAGEAPGPEPLTLRPGESATSGLVWRMMSPDAPTTYLEIAPAPGERSRTLETDGPIDLVDTGRLGTGAWRKAG